MEQRSWSVHVEFAVIFITLIGGFYTLDSKIEKQGARTDKLYEMFVDLQKEIKQEAKEFHGRVSVMETKIEGK
jgi:hypothetical protein